MTVLGFRVGLLGSKYERRHALRLFSFSRRPEEEEEETLIAPGRRKDEAGRLEGKEGRSKTQEVQAK